MAYFYKPQPDATRVLRDLAELIAHAMKLRITLTIDGPGLGETSKVVIDRRLESVRDHDE